MYRQQVDREDLEAVRGGLENVCQQLNAALQGLEHRQTAEIALADMAGRLQGARATAESTLRTSLAMGGGGC